MICEYKTLILDMYGVIIEESRGNFLSYVYSCFPETHHEKIDRLINQEKLYEKAVLGLIGAGEFLTALGFEHPYLAVENYIENHLTLDKDFTKFAEKASKKYELVLLSNDVLEFNKHITQYHDIDKYFKDKIVSAEVKCGKPSLEIFDIAIEKIQRKPSECIFVDNRPKNLLAAEEVGISTVLFNRDNVNHDGMTVNSFKELWDIIG